MAGEALQGALRGLEGCARELHLPEDVLKVSIDWTKLQDLPMPQPALLTRALQQHILRLQLLLEKLQPFADGGKQESAKVASIAKPMETCAESVAGTEGSRTVTQKEVFAEPKDGSNVKEAVGRFDHEVVQIKAQKAEIDRRIMAFIERKQAEINENNVREFCNVIDCNQENSCARTDAVFTPYPGFKSHVKVSRVVNTYGPQTRIEGAPASSLKASTLSRDCGNQAVEERLQNIEAHLRLQTGGPVPKDIYMRIKTLEEKILELEGLSPEYFQSVGFSGKRKKTQAVQSYTLAELDEKIIALRETLLRKSKESQSRNADKLLL